MPKIKHIATGEIYTVSANPVWSPDGGPHGLWVCGDQNFTDPKGDQYEVVERGAEAHAALTPMTFYLAFKPAERIAIKASADAMVKEFWATYELAAQLNNPIDPNLVSVTQALGYLAMQPTDTPPGPGILASANRVSEILAGVPQ